MFSKKKSSKDEKSKDSKESTDLGIRLDNVEMESVSEQLREIEAKKAKDSKSS